FFDRVWRPEQLPAALLGAMRVLTDPAETGAVTLALPQDVQAEAHDWPEQLFTERTCVVARPFPATPQLSTDRAGCVPRAWHEPPTLQRAVELLPHARQPLVIAGGGDIYSEASAA